MQTYVKIAFHSFDGKERTAGLVIPFEEFKAADLSRLSRLFPYSEARKMRGLLVSPQFPTFEQAFAFSFEGGGRKLNPVKIAEVEYTLPAYWACPLLYGDESGLEGRESEEIESFLARAKTEHGGALCCVGVGEPEFRWRNDATSEGGECCVFSFHVAGRASE